jgi:uncharacterized protein (AIM24 family)
MPQYELENAKVLRVTLRGEVAFARVGSMIAYTGEVAFQRAFLAGGGVQALAMRQVTNEGMAMMAAQGSGTVLYGQDGRHITIISLQGDTLYVEGDSVLAFDTRLRSGTSFLGNGGVSSFVSGMATGQGLFTSTFSGSGDVAILSDGKAIPLEVRPDRPVFVDPQAYLAHSGSLTSAIHTDVGWKTLLGQTSGESYQLRFQGQGTVYIQASER